MRFCIRHTVRKIDQMQRSGDRVRIATAQDKQRRLELCLRFWCLCATRKKTDHTRETLSASAKKRKNIPILYFLNCFIGLFLHTQKKNCLQSFQIASGLLIEHKKQEEKTCIILKLKNALLTV